MAGVALTAAGAVLIPILRRAGARILAGLIEEKAPVAHQVIREIAEAAGVEPTPAALEDADPEAIGAAAVAVEERSAEHWMYLLEAQRNTADLLAREDDRGWFWHGWRPSTSWILLVFLWPYALVVQPLLNAAFQLSLDPVPLDQLATFSGLWALIYSGGHTAKAIWARGRG